MSDHLVQEIIPGDVLRWWLDEAEPLSCWSSLL